MRTKTTKSFIAATRAITSPTYRHAIRKAYRAALGDAYKNSLNDSRRAVLSECIWGVENEVEHTICQEPWGSPRAQYVEQMRALRNSLYDDLGWQGN